MNNLYNVGELVTFKTHPLLFDFYIKGDGKYVPPIMIVKEVVFESKDKKEFDEQTGNQISGKVKYVCVHFDDNKSEFIESIHYEEFLGSFKSLKIAKIENNLNSDNYIDIITEIGSYPEKAKYSFGEIVYFKTKKLEAFKKRESSKIEVEKNKEEKKITRQYVVNYISPDFVLSGYKKETYTDLFYGNGKPKRKVSVEFVKVKWFNPIQQKFSEQYLPIEFFIDFNPFGKKITV